MKPIYLTQAKIEGRLAAKFAVNNSYAWHQHAWKCFPCRDGQPREFLTRVDQTDGLVRLLVVSSEFPVRPTWCPPECWATKLIPPAYLSHDYYSFQLLANPTRMNKDTRKRYPVCDRQSLENWIARKAEQHGFSLNPSDVMFHHKEPSFFEKRNFRGLHNAVEIFGKLKVSDKEKFTQTLLSGIGSAKAFGFGLLVVVPSSP
jgi:CRISPR system Cascade subunit CasE